MSELNPNAIKWIEEKLGIVIDIKKHEHSNQDEVYSIKTTNAGYYVKSSTDLKSENENLTKLQGKLNVPEVIDYANIDQRDYLLISALPGNNLVELIGNWNDIEIVNKFAEAVKMLHKLEVTIIYPDSSESDVILHGDMALPNVIIASNGDIGYIDFGQMSHGSAELDIYDSIWSLQRNLGPYYGEMFLENYGPVERTDKIEEILKYRHQPNNDKT